NGVHDIHMNQGNNGRFRADDGVWQDGGLLIHLPTRSRWIGIFLAFQSQSWHTDDSTGHTLPDAPPHPDRDTAAIRILAALVNPAPAGPGTPNRSCPQPPPPLPPPPPAGIPPPGTAATARYRPDRYPPEPPSPYP